MFLEVGIIIAGIPVGFALRKSSSIKKIVAKCSICTVYALLFFLGLKLGANDMVMSKLDVLGLRALCVGIGVIGGSLLAGRIIHKYLKGLN